MDSDTADDGVQGVDDIGNVLVNRTTIQVLSKHGKIKSNELKMAYQKAFIYPSKEEWVELSYRFFMAAGVLLLMSGIMFFFAYNWQDMHKFAKLGLLETGLILAVLPLLLFKPQQFIQQLGLTVVSVLTGVALAVFGQIYQTGADAYDFFLGWTILITAWVVISNFSFLWIFYLLLINITIAQYFDQRLGHLFMYVDQLMLVLIVLNIAALAIWEYSIKGSRSNWAHNLCIWTIGVVVMTMLTIQLVIQTNWYKEGDMEFIYWSVYLAWVLGAGYYYTQKVKDIAFVAMFSISFLVVFNTVIINMFFDYSDAGFYLMLSLFNIIMSIVLVIFLVNLNKKWLAEKTAAELQIMDSSNDLKAN